jgi:hypothetical protein
MLDVCNYSVAPDKAFTPGEEPYRFIREYYLEQAREWDRMLEAVSRLLEWPRKLIAPPVASAPFMGAN